jgi:hypothetical protein
VAVVAVVELRVVVQAAILVLVGPVFIVVIEVVTTAVILIQTGANSTTAGLFNETLVKPKPTTQGKLEAGEKLLAEAAASVWPPKLC